MSSDPRIIAELIEHVETADEPVLWQLVNGQDVEKNLDIAIHPTEWAVFVEACQDDFDERAAELAGELFTDFEPEEEEPEEEATT